MELDDFGIKEDIISTITKRHGYLECRKIDKKEGAELIIKNHYSHKNVKTSSIYLGLFKDNILLGVASLGIAMNPIPTTKTVKGSTIENYLELNRLWISDEIRDNIESVFIGMVFKYIKRKFPLVKWIQSFADGRVGVGTIYQACNFLYCGFHYSKFWKNTLTGEVYHNSILTRKTRKKYYELQKIIDKLESFTTKTYKYIYFLDKKQEKNLTLKILPYPKRI